MAAVLALFGALMVLVGLVAFVWFLVAAFGHGWAAARQPTSRRYQLVLATISFSGAVLLGGVPFLAVSIAEGQNSWTDADGDGMLDGFVNGAYDWVDINGGDWFRAVGVMVAVTVGTTLLLSRLVRQAGPAGFGGERVPWRREAWGDPWAGDSHPHEPEPGARSQRVRGE